MALLFIDGFDHYSTADITQKWTSYGSTTISAAAGRRGGGALSCPTGGTWVIRQNFAATDVVCIGFALYLRAAISGAGDLCNFGDAGADQCGIYLNTDGTIAFRRGTTTLATSATAISSGTWVYLELKVTISDASGAYEVRLNGANILSGSSVDTKATANASVNSVSIGYRPSTTLGAVNVGTGSYIDDLYILDDAGSNNTTFLGDCRIDTLLPSANGNSSQLTGSDGNSTDNYLLVDEASQDGDTTYVSSSTASQKDTYDVTSITHTPSSIFGVQINMTAKKDDSGTRSIASVTRSGGSDTDGTTQGLSTDYADYLQIVETDPNTAALWTKTNLNLAEFGVKVAA